MAALTVAVLVAAGAAMGSINLLVDDVIRPGASRWIYGATMLLLGVVAATLAVRRRIGRWTIFALVLLGDLIYLVIALSVTDPLRYATPLMMLFAAFVAAWFLDGWMLVAHLVVTPVIVAVALAGSYDDVAGLLVQVCVDAGVLDLAAAGVFVLRRRIERLLASTQELSRRDPLTGLGNRRHLEEQARRVWRQSRRDGVRVAAMVLDLDHFKQLNDAHGHAAGDAVLRSVAAALTASVRPTDVLARLGGEELAVLGMVGDPTEAHRLAERLRRAVAGARTASGHVVTASIGIALVRPAEGEDPVDGLWRLLDLADAAMYQAKQGGRDRVATVPAPRPPSAPAASVVAGTADEMGGETADAGAA
ncbi:diguanylate cyclase (GGDEF) domain-containing protein [Trujillonella endophytica]|uniref:Diguanylate cyclase (GGDEF) domain-containing protein n=1 Tax=Trujillonella endophytica TaxID=673521 RepID=A0A1H8VQP6_9ACTN|nr:diguanylate cyclase (GGDEF) domain-containing protein [Trujillella endophytica]